MPCKKNRTLEQRDGLLHGAKFGVNTHIPAGLVYQRGTVHTHSAQGPPTACNTLISSDVFRLNQHCTNGVRSKPADQWLQPRVQLHSRSNSGSVCRGSWAPNQQNLTHEYEINGKVHRKQTVQGWILIFYLKRLKIKVSSEHEVKFKGAVCKKLIKNWSCGTGATIPQLQFMSSWELNSKSTF